MPTPSKLSFELPPLPYGLDDLSPHMSADTLSFHHGKHHAAYLANLANLIQGTPWQNYSELAGRQAAGVEAQATNAEAQATDTAKQAGETVIAKIIADIGPNSADPADRKLYNNAAQAWNHAFFWQSMSPQGGGDPKGALAEAVEKSFGSAQDFVRQFTQTAVGLFGSGWVWLATRPTTPENPTTPQGTATPPTTPELEILTSPNAEIPAEAFASQSLLFTLDVWEHAYYLDFQNDRASYVKTWTENLLNWDFASKNYTGN